MNEWELLKKEMLKEIDDYKRLHNSQDELISEFLKDIKSALDRNELYEKWEKRKE